MYEKIKVEHTGSVWTNSWDIQTYLEKDGSPSPIMGYIGKGYKPERFFYQIVPQKGFKVWAYYEGRNFKEVEGITLVGEWDLNDTVSNTVKKKVEKVQVDMESWKGKRGCYSPISLNGEIPKHHVETPADLFSLPEEIFDSWIVGELTFKRNGGYGFFEEETGAFLSFKVAMHKLSALKKDWFGYSQSHKSLEFNLSRSKSLRVEGDFYILHQMAGEDYDYDYICWAPTTVYIYIKNGCNQGFIPENTLFRIGQKRDYKL